MSIKIKPYKKPKKKWYYRWKCKDCGEWWVSETKQNQRCYNCGNKPELIEKWMNDMIYQMTRNKE